MTGLWRKSELGFALIWIGVYVIGSPLSALLGGHIATAAFHLGAGLFLLLWVRGQGLAERYGLCSGHGLRVLWYLPLVLLASKNLWNGVALPPAGLGTLVDLWDMIGVGFLEELLFRGFLFRAVGRKGVRRGVVLSSLAFALGHAVNLFNGSGMTLGENLWQMGFAVAFGVLFATLFARSGTLWPCVLTHAVFNVASLFAKEADPAAPALILQNTAALLLMVGYTWFIAASSDWSEKEKG